VLKSLAIPRDSAVIGTVHSGLPAYRAGLREGDRILAVAGEPITAFDEIQGLLRPRTDRDVAVSIRRGEKQFTVNVKPLSQTGGGGKKDGIIGIEPVYQAWWTHHDPAGTVLGRSFASTGELFNQVLAGMWLTISRPLYYRDYVGGPVFIGQMASDAAKRGPDEFLGFLAMINIAIMLFNLLPVPLLDGGHVLLALLEAVRRRSLTARAYLNFQKAGLVLVGTLFVFIVSKDFVRPLQRMRAVERTDRETTTVAPAPR
jgi:regulator of sigma E protease